MNDTYFMLYHEELKSQEVEEDRLFIPKDGGLLSERSLSLEVFRFGPGGK